jgi:hypothetical protein
MSRLNFLNCKFPGYSKYKISAEEATKKYAGRVEILKLRIDGK